MVIRRLSSLKATNIDFYGTKDLPTCVMFERMLLRRKEEWIVCVRLIHSCSLLVGVLSSSCWLLIDGDSCLDITV